MKPIIFNNYLLPPLLVALTIGSICGCGGGSTKSGKVSSEEIGADIVIIASGDGSSSVSVVLSDQSLLIPRELQLTSGDQLIATANAETRTLVDTTPLDNQFVYQTSFAFDDPGTNFTIALNRNSRPSAPNSLVVLPDSASFVLPVANSQYASDQDLDISWDPSGLSTNVDLIFNSRCPITGGLMASAVDEVSVADTGAYSFDLDIIVQSFSVGPTSLSSGTVCEVDIDIQRVQAGQLDTIFDGNGSIVAVQSRRRSINLFIVL